MKILKAVFSITRKFHIFSSTVYIIRMGLGKTLTVIAFSYLFLKYKKGKRILITCPRSVIQCWEREITTWMDVLKLEYIPCFVMDHGKDSYDERHEKMFEWSNKGGILLTSFSSFTTWTDIEETESIIPGGDSKRHSQQKIEFRKKITSFIENSDLVIVDEGQRMKSPSSKLTQSLHKHIKTRNRIVLTGVPPLAHAKEYYTIIDWVRPGYWSEKEFMELTSPSLHSIDHESNMDQSKQNYHILMHELGYFVHRKDQSVLKTSLPPKKEYVIYFNINDIQRKLYNNFIQSRDVTCEWNQQIVFYTASIIQKILNHPDIARMYCKSKQVEHKSNVGRNSNEDIIPSIASGHDKEFVSVPSMAEDDASLIPTISNTMFNMLEEAEQYNDVQESFEWAAPVLDKYYHSNMIDNSPKMLCLIRIIEETFINSEKLLVFSQYQESLDVIEKIINTVNITTGNSLPLEDEEQPLKRKLQRNIDYYRLDETMSTSFGQNIVDSFNSSNDVPLFLISTKTGPLGIDLSTSQKIVLFDVCWDPTWDNQAVFRSFRYGQTKPVTIYRFVMANTIESKIFEKLCVNNNDQKEDNGFLSKFDFVPVPDEQAALEQPTNHVTTKNDPVLNKIMSSEPRLKRCILDVKEYESLYIDSELEIASLCNQSKKLSVSPESEHTSDDTYDSLNSDSDDTGSSHSDDEEPNFDEEEEEE